MVGIYAIVNKINSHKYIGRTTRGFELRKLGKKPTEAQLNGLSKGQGPKSEQTKANISAALMGHTHSEETKRKIGEASKLYERDDAYRQKMSEVKKGHPVSEETKEKIRQKRLAYWERKRAGLA
jgi:hypothetical protein